MVALALFLLPLVFAAIALVVPSNRARPALLPVAGAAHAALTLRLLAAPAAPALDGWLALDPVARVALPLVSALFFLCSAYAAGYLRLRADPQRGLGPDKPGAASPAQGQDNRTFCACLLVLLAMMTLMLEAHHLGLMWVALEACTLASAPLIYFHRNPRSLEALWKYLLIGSVGIAVALLGSLFLAYSALRSGLVPSLLLEDLIRDAPSLSRSWLHAAFILLFIGYGTKMGLAPMHTWKPDAYGESTGLVGTLLAGGLTSCAFVAILRFYKIAVAADDGAFAREMMIAAGLLSMAFGAVFMARQRDYKRMLAYSSVEHMGILVLGVGIGGAAAFGALLHLVNNALTKAVLFLAAGNIHRVYGSKTTDVARGAMRRLPASGALLLAGFLAIAGSPPFGLFLSEFTILNATIARGRYVIAGSFLVLLLLVFIGMGSTVLAVVQGDPPPEVAATTDRDTFLTLAPLCVALGLVLLLGLYIPAPVEALLRDGAAWLEAP